ncbi:Protein of unknown function [Cotesia congregata]|uniref:Uncharacterized protein n=1 Tax=Cotesia congregata TaxID=51543 RepID=A0A8J2H7W8_COTCN|nr:Protein of unknown function [Cotesia congregata]
MQSTSSSSGSSRAQTEQRAESRLFLTIIVGINSKTFPYKDYQVTQETSYEGDVKNFTQALNKTVGKVTTIDRTVELTNNMTNRKISTDHSITTTNDSVVTFDRTLEQFDTDSNLALHDHFFNTSNGDTVTTGRNCTKWSSDDKNIEYVEDTDGKNRDRTIHFTTERLREKGNININRACLVHKKNGLKEIYANTTVYRDGKLGSVDNSVAFINNSEYVVDYSITNFFPDRSDIEHHVATFHVSKLTTLDTNIINIYVSTNYTSNSSFIVILDDEGGKNVTYINKEVYPDGKEVFQSRNAKLDVSNKCYSDDDTCESKDIIDYMRVNGNYFINKAIDRFNELGTIEEKAKKESQDLMDKKYKCSK